MFEFLAISAFTWMLMFSFLFVLIGSWTSAFENVAISVIFLIVAGLIGYFFVPGSFVLFLVHNPVQTILYSILYLGAGCLYTVYRHWPRFLDSSKNTIVRHYKNINENIKNNNELLADKEANEASNPEKYNTYTYKHLEKMESVTYDDYINSSEFAYNASDHKNMLSNAILMWVFIALWDFIESPLKWIKEKCYTLIVKALNKITADKTAQFNPDK